MAHPDQTIATYIEALGRNAKAAARGLALASTNQKNAALSAAAKCLRERWDEIEAANYNDLAKAKSENRADAFLDRLMLDKTRIESIADAVAAVAELPDPVGRVLQENRRPNGLNIKRVATPLGVIAMVYESRPNVGADASALCLKSGNAVILRGGSDSINSSRVIIDCMKQGIDQAGLPADAVQYVDTPDRSGVAALLQCTAYVDLAIPRGGRGLVELVRNQAKVPTLLHLDGNCYTYIHEDADMEKATQIVTNAKLRRTGICSATESLVIDRKIAPEILPKLADALGPCEIRGDGEACSIDPRLVPAHKDDWDTEYLDEILSVKIVSELSEAIEFVALHSSAHTDAIITENNAAAQAFLAQIDSAVVIHNASTQFSDGGEFGMGAEIGIATGKLHARGPVGLEQLTSFKYIVHGNGQIRG